MPRRDGSTPGSTEDLPGDRLRRWSRRKQAARRGDEMPAEPAPAEAPVDAMPATGMPAVPEPEPTCDAPVLTDEDMPPLASLHGESDVSGFFSEGVSEELRRAALRKLFLSPVFNVRDGLNDYDEDFTTFEHLGDVVTSDMRHQREMRERAAAQADADARADRPERVDREDAASPELERSDVEPEDDTSVAAGDALEAPGPERGEGVDADAAPDPAAAAPDADDDEDDDEQLPRPS